ncbi:hypothetical protein ACOMHN_052856 [Nucella lapillus]
MEVTEMEVSEMEVSEMEVTEMEVTEMEVTEMEVTVVEVTEMEVTEMAVSVVEAPAEVFVKLSGVHVIGAELGKVSRLTSSSAVEVLNVTPRGITAAAPVAVL